MKFLKNYEIQHLDQNYDFLVRHLQDATQNNELQITKDGLDNLINVLKHNIVLEDEVKEIKDAAREEGHEDGYEYDKWDIRCKNCIERENAYAILADCGVPFDQYGEPIGIWSD
jgi:hypothetical protein